MTAITMDLPHKPGTLGNLTPEEEGKLQEAWVHLLRLCGFEDLDADKFSSIPDRSDVFRQHLTDKTPEGFKKILWASVRTENPDGLVLRFLRARKWNVEKGVIMMISAVDWRSERKVDSELVFHGESVALKETLSTDDKGFMQQYRSGKSYVRGTDKAQRPVYIIRVRLHDPYAQTSECMESYILHNIESLRVLVKAPYDEACLIFDMTGFGLKNMDFHVVKFLVQVFESKYPETLGVVLIHNAPFVFWGTPSHAFSPSYTDCFNRHMEHHQGLVGPGNRIQNQLHAQQGRHGAFHLQREHAEVLWGH